MDVQVKNDVGLQRSIKVGFSWTAFFFGGFVFFFRGMPTQGVMWGLLSLVTLGFSNLFLIFMVNKMTAQHYLENGYKPIGDNWAIAGPKWNVAIAADAQ